MDKFKENTFKDYDAWDLNCPYICRLRKTRNKLINIFKRKARRRLKRELKSESEDKYNESM